MQWQEVSFIKKYLVRTGRRDRDHTPDAYTPLQITATGSASDIIVKLPLTLKKADFAAIKADITNVAGTNSHHHRYHRRR